MEQSRMFLAIALSMLVMFVYYTVIAPPPEMTPINQGQSKGSSSASEEKLPQESDDHILNAQKDTKVPVTAVVSDNIQKATQVPFENQRVSGLLSSIGGWISEFKLKDFSVSTDKKDQPINLLSDVQSSALYEVTLNYTPHDQGIEYKVLSDKELESGRVITMQAHTQDLIIKKVLVVGTAKNPNMSEIKIEVQNKGSKPVNINPTIWMKRSQKERRDKGFIASLSGPEDLWYPMTYKDGGLEVEYNWDELPERTTLNGKLPWAGLSDRYFLMALIARQDSNVTSHFGRKGDVVYQALSYGNKTIAQGETQTYKFSGYAGPKRHDDLVNVGSGIEASIDYGFFSWIATPLLWLLTHLQKIVINWGLTIIALTFLVKLLLHPINKKAVVSMKAMQKLQPRLKEMREKYADDKQRLNQEMMALFKTHKVNPMGGCLPMVIQMPVYIGLYKVLWNAVELYQAPFFWIYQDLSAPDPFFITPILLGIAMVAQQKLNPQAATMDPAQQKVMMIMPLMFTVFMAFFPFGLNLYILVNTIMSVVQQYMIHEEITVVDIAKGRFRKVEA